jgi:HKD family nuclease
MTPELLLQTGKTPKEHRISAWFKADGAAPGIKDLRVACAYASVGGVRAILDHLDHDTCDQSTWIIGLDDLITHPGALDVLRKASGASVRVPKKAAAGRFHPKFYLLTPRTAADRRIAYVGSANASQDALNRNAEMVVRLTATSAADIATLEEAWQDVFAQSVPLTDATLEDYRQRYKNRPKPPPGTKAAQGNKVGPATKGVLNSDEAILDPSQASTCWIECGAVTMQGRELELKGEQALFFGLPQQGGEPGEFKFRVSDGKRTDLRLVYQQNKMWRLQMTPAIPEVEAGLRPVLAGGGLGRSTLTAVFRRGAKPKHYVLSFVENGSPDRKVLEKQAQDLGTLGKTRAGASGRLYGWS